MAAASISIRLLVSVFLWWGLPVSLGSRMRQQRNSTAAPAVSPIRHEDIALLWAVSGEGLNSTTQAQTPSEVQHWKNYRPCASCQSYVRLGEGNDGGYVMCGELIQGTKAVYSYGISGYDGWGAAMSDRLGGVAIQQYDCFNLNRPVCPGHMSCNFAFHPQCIATTSHIENGRPYASLADQMTQNGHLPGPSSSVDMVMKMDVEGAEWAVFADDTNKPLLQHFSQVVVEFHAAHQADPVRTRALQNLLELFTVVHVHANNCCGSYTTPSGHSVPQVLEVSFVRRGLVQETTCVDAPAQSHLDHRNLVTHPHPAPIRLGA